MTPTDAHCQRCESPLEAGDLRCAICSLPCPTVRPEDLPATAVEVLRCTGCGAAMTYDTAVRAPSCAFCARKLELVRPGDPLETADDVLPFFVSRPEAQATLRSWFDGLGWFRPSDLRSAARVESIRPLQWVAWVFDAEAVVSWAADTEVGARKADWAPHAGVTSLVFDDVFISASRGLSDAETAELAASYDLDRSSQPGVRVEEIVEERFDVPRSVARRRIIAAINRLARSRLTEGHLPGHRLRNLATEVLLRRLETRRCALPAWVLAYRYRDRLYRFVVSGQDCDCRAGEAPVSKAKIIGAVVTAVGTLLALATLVVLLSG